MGVGVAVVVAMIGAVFVSHPTICYTQQVTIPYIR